MNVELISITPDAEKTMAHIARVSNPNNQDNPNYAGLLRYCIKHNHWSVFEQSSMTLTGKYIIQEERVDLSSFFVYNI